MAIETGLLHPIQDAIDAAQPGDMIMLNGSVMPSVAGTNAVRCDMASIGNVNECRGLLRCGELSRAGYYVEAGPLAGCRCSIDHHQRYEVPDPETGDVASAINTLFGLDSQGNTLPGTPQVDPLPGQEITGGIVLLEPSVLGTEEGAGITVLAKGLRANGTPFTNCDGNSKVPGNFLCAPPASTASHHGRRRWWGHLRQRLGS